MMNQNDGNKITINFKRASGESVSLKVKKTDKPIDIIPQLEQKWPNSKVNQLAFNRNNILNCEQTWSELTKENNIRVFVGCSERLITVHFKKLGTEEGFGLYVKKDDKICDIVSRLGGEFLHFEITQLTVDNLESKLIWSQQSGEVKDKTWGELHAGEDINVTVHGKDRTILGDLIENKSTVNQSTIKWKFIFSSSPFLVLTLLALILQWHIAFVISLLVISLVLVAIGLWPKIKTCCPRKISSSYETENTNPREENISQNPNLNQDYQQNHDRNF